MLHAAARTVVNGDVCRGSCGRGRAGRVALPTTAARAGRPTLRRERPRAAAAADGIYDYMLLSSHANTFHVPADNVYGSEGGLLTGQGGTNGVTAAACEAQLGRRVRKRFDFSGFLFKKSEPELEKTG